jgi:hypothetical protein
MEEMVTFRNELIAFTMMLSPVISSWFKWCKEKNNFGSACEIGDNTP